jgi:radical SAM superfamily enzyme YgiQ (UPF0313 family)
MNAPTIEMVRKPVPTRDWDAVEAVFTALVPGRSIRRVLLINPPDADASIFQYETARRGRYTNYPPYGLAILAEHLRRANVDARILNLNHVILKGAHAAPNAEAFDHFTTWTTALDEAIADYQPDLIGVSCMFTMTHTSLKEVCERAAKSCIPVGIGGVHVTNDVERVLDDIPAASVAFLREGDNAIVRFVHAVNGQGPLSALGQVIIREPPTTDAADRARHRFLAECQPLEDEISLVPAFDLLDVPEYSRYGTIGAFYCFKPKDTIFATTLSNRGCRAQCTFCSVRNFNGKGVRQRDYLNVVDEIQLLVEKYGVGHFMWLDDDLLKDEERALAMFNEIVRRNIKVTWDATNGLIASSCTEELVAAMAASGCIAVNIGMESGNPQILRQIKKPGTIKNFISAAEIFRRYEQIHTSILLIVGFPNETMSMVQDTLTVAREMDCDWYRISPLQPLPNTPIYDAMVAQGLIQDVGSKELRFMGGAFGKQAEIEQGLRLAELGFKEAFSAIPLDAVPSKEQVTDIWFYMNYHLNFHRLFTETRPIKIHQQQQNLKALSEVISPENGFALYFLGVLEHRLNGTISPAIIERLRRRLETSPYWLDRFAAFGLSVADLERADFKNKHIPRLLPGGASIEAA